MHKHKNRIAFLALASAFGMVSAFAQQNNNNDAGTDQGCFALPGYQALKAQLAAAVLAETSGLNNHMWATIVDRNGIVCAVAYSGSSVGAQWLGSRVISAQKANTANDFSLDGSAVSNGAPDYRCPCPPPSLFSAVQPGGSLFRVAGEQSCEYGGGLCGACGRLWNPKRSAGWQSHRRCERLRRRAGSLCRRQCCWWERSESAATRLAHADHFIAWRLRNLLNLDHLGTGDSGTGRSPL